MNNGLISKQSAIDEIECELEMINSALDSMTLDFNARERLRQRRGEAREILNSIQQLPSAQPEIVRCVDCKHKGTKNCVANAWATIFGVTVKDDFYCGLAERRTANE